MRNPLYGAVALAVLAAIGAAIAAQGQGNAPYIPNANEPTDGATCSAGRDMVLIVMPGTSTTSEPVEIYWCDHSGSGKWRNVDVAEAQSLGGIDATGFAVLAENEIITGDWTFGMDGDESTLCIESELLAGGTRKWCFNPTPDGALTLAVAGATPNFIVSEPMQVSGLFTALNGLTVQSGSLTVVTMPNCNSIDTNSSGVMACGTDSGTPAGSGSELQYRATASTLGAVTGSSVSGGTLTLSALTISNTLLHGNAVTGTVEPNMYYACYPDGDSACVFNVTGPNSGATSTSATVMSRYYDSGDVSEVSTCMTRTGSATVSFTGCTTVNVEADLVMTDDAEDGVNAGKDIDFDGDGQITSVRQIGFELDDDGTLEGNLLKLQPYGSATVPGSGAEHILGTGAVTPLSAMLPGFNAVQMDFDGNGTIDQGRAKAIVDAGVDQDVKIDANGRAKLTGTYMRLTSNSGSSDTLAAIWWQDDRDRDSTLDTQSSAWFPACVHPVSGHTITVASGQSDGDGDGTDESAIWLEDVDGDGTGDNRTLDSVNDLLCLWCGGDENGYTCRQQNVDGAGASAYADIECVRIFDLASDDDDVTFWAAPAATTVREVGCRYDGTAGTVAQISLEDSGGTAMTHTTPTCVTGATAITYQSVTAAGDLAEGEGLAFDVDNVPDGDDRYTICVKYSVDPT